MTTPTGPAGGHTPMSSQAFLALGSLHVAYIKTIAVDGAVAYAVHAADGAQLAVFDNRDLAMITARQNDLEPVSAH